ncbi:MAG: Arc family DNA-binding protein [Pseudomonadota bacterium]
MPNLSIKSVPEALAESLRQRAARNHRSLQGELMAILEAAVSETPMLTTAPANQPPQTASFSQAASQFRNRFSKPLGAAMDSTAIVREMRDTHYGEAWVMARVKDGHWPLQPGDSDPLPASGPIHKAP